MEVQTCRKCGRLFNYLGVGDQLCPVCRDKEEDVFKRVNEYLWEHKGATMLDVINNCEAEEKQIRKWIRDQRIEFAKGSGVTIPCEQCGTPIYSGRLCEKCKKSLTDTVNGFYGKKEENEFKLKRQDEHDRMRFI